MCVRVCACAYVCMRGYGFECVHICVCVCVCVCACVHVCVSVCMQMHEQENTHMDINTDISMGTGRVQVHQSLSGLQEQPPHLQFRLDAYMYTNLFQGCRSSRLI